MENNLSKEVYKDLIEVTVDLITVVDEFGVIQYENQSAQHVIRYDPDDRIGETTFDYIHPDDRQMVFERFSDLVKKSTGYTTDSVEFRHQHIDGSWVWLEARGSNREAASDNRYVFTSRDITQRKQYEQALKQERDRLDEFAGVVSHDLQNPLNVAEGRLELAQEECDCEHLDAIETALHRINRITEDVLWLSREGRDIGSLDEVAVADAFDAAWNIVADRTEHAELHYADDKVPTAKIEADDDRLRQLLENLFSNAIEHGGEDVTVTVGVVDTGFYVEDDGPGIPEDEREEVFTAGYSTGEEGTGFGLSIVKQIAEAHDWEITISEGTDGGARFEITGVDFTAE